MSAAATASKPRMRLLEWRPFVKKTLRGFATVELPIGLVIRDISVHDKGGKRWAGLPAKPILDADGRQVSNHAGHKQYAALLGWRDRDLADRFSAAVVAAVVAEHDLDGGAA
jgi:hypothetical protein